MATTIPAHRRCASTVRISARCHFPISYTCGVRSASFHSPWNSAPRSVLHRNLWTSKASWPEACVFQALRRDHRCSPEMHELAGTRMSLGMPRVSDLEQVLTRGVLPCKAPNFAPELWVTSLHEKNLHPSLDCTLTIPLGCLYPHPAGRTFVTVPGSEPRRNEA